MSDTTPGATAVANTADALPRDAAGAAALRESLTANAEYMANWKEDQGKQSTLAYLRWVSGGNDPDAWGRPPATPDEVRAQMQDRDREIDDRRVDTYAKFISDFDEQKRATIARGLATKEQHDEAVREVERMKKDGVFARRVLTNDSAAVDAWTRFNLIASMRVAPADHDWSK